MVVTQRSRIGNLFRALCGLEVHKNQEVSLAKKRMKATVPVNTKTDGNQLQHAIYMTATSHAAKLMVAQLTKLSATHEVSPCDMGCSVTVDGGKSHVATVTGCDCSFHSTTTLPCAHMFA